MGPAIPDLSGFAPQPLIDPPRRKVQHELPEPELSWGQPSTLMILDPGPDRYISRLDAETSDGLPRTRSEDAADDLVPVPIPVKGTGFDIPEELLDQRR